MSKKEKSNKRTIGLFFKVSEEEKALIQKKMKLLHTSRLFTENGD